MAIQVLPSEVVNQIAAGEVLERPANLVKELLENAVDAGATQIEIDFSDGARNVQIKDNGCGMSESDLQLAFARHATSKITQSQDLWSLDTFGFRGEALASIGSVSRATLTTRRVSDPTAHRLTCDFGRLEQLQTVGGSQGTSILIENLFSNVPARLKFLKSDAAEISQVKRVLKAMALSNPQITITVRSDSRLLYHWPSAIANVNADTATAAAAEATAYLARIKSVLDIDELYAAESSSGGSGAIHVRSFFAPPQINFGTSQNIWLFAQGRWIQDRSIQAAVTNAFRNLLMHGQFPIAVVQIMIPPEDIDVNIHPTKAQVKFKNPSHVFGVVHNQLRSRLEMAPWLKPSTPYPEGPTHFEPSNVKDLGGAPVRPLTQQAPQENLSLSEFEFRSTQYQQKKTPIWNEAERPTLEQLKIQGEARKSYYQVSDASSPYLYWSRLQVLAQTNLTYIIAQSSKGLLLIDQHASHERVLFEKIMEGWKKGGLEAQDFLIPLVVEMDESLAEALLTKTAELLRLEIRVEPMGPDRIAVSSAPSFLKDAAISSALDKFARDIVENGQSFAIEKAMADIAATMACHSAIRAGQALSVEEMVQLLIQMDEYPLSSFCPHGRPVFFEHTFNSLDREFGRI